MYGLKLGAALLLTAACSFPEASSTKGVWHEDPVIKSGKCVDIKGLELINFIDKHYVPLVKFEENQNLDGEKLVLAYAISSSLLTKSQICLTEALDIKGFTDDLEKQLQILKKGNSLDSDDLKTSRELSKNVDRKIRKALNKKQELKPEQRRSFSIGTTLYGGTIYALKQMKDPAVGYTKKYGKSLTDFVKKAKDLPKQAPTVKNIFKKEAQSPSGGAQTIKNAQDTAEDSKALYEASKKLSMAAAKAIADLAKRTGKTGQQIYRYSQSNKLTVDKDIQAKIGW